MVFKLYKEKSKKWENKRRINNYELINTLKFEHLTKSTKQRKK